MKNKKDNIVKILVKVWYIVGIIMWTFLMFSSDDFISSWMFKRPIWAYIFQAE